MANGGSYAVGIGAGYESSDHGKLIVDSNMKVYYHEGNQITEIEKKK